MKLHSQFNGLEFQKTWQEVRKREAKDHYGCEKKCGWTDFTAVGMFFEGIGILLERRLIDIELVDDMFTSPIEWTWEKMENNMMEARKVENQSAILEWFEYLYEMKKREQGLQQIRQWTQILFCF